MVVADTMTTDISLSPEKPIFTYQKGSKPEFGSIDEYNRWYAMEENKRKFAVREYIFKLFDYIEHVVLNDQEFGKQIIDTIIKRNIDEIFIAHMGDTMQADIVTYDYFGDIAIKVKYGDIREACECLIRAKTNPVLYLLKNVYNQLRLFSSIASMGSPDIDIVKCTDINQGMLKEFKMLLYPSGYVTLKCNIRR